MTRQEALDLATERGHVLTLTMVPAVVTYRCQRCACALIVFDGNHYGSALERDCVKDAAA